MSRQGEERHGNEVAERRRHTRQEQMAITHSLPADPVREMALEEEDEDEEDEATTLRNYLGAYLME